MADQHSHLQFFDNIARNLLDLRARRTFPGKSDRNTTEDLQSLPVGPFEVNGSLCVYLGTDCFTKLFRYAILAGAIIKEDFYLLRVMDLDSAATRPCSNWKQVLGVYVGDLLQQWIRFIKPNAHVERLTELPTVSIVRYVSPIIASAGLEGVPPIGNMSGIGGFVF